MTCPFDRCKSRTQSPLLECKQLFDMFHSQGPAALQAAPAKALGSKLEARLKTKRLLEILTARQYADTVDDFRTTMKIESTVETPAKNIVWSARVPSGSINNDFTALCSLCFQAQGTMDALSLFLRLSAAQGLMLYRRVLSLEA